MLLHTKISNQWETKIMATDSEHPAFFCQLAVKNQHSRRATQRNAVVYHENLLVSRPTMHWQKSTSSHFLSQYTYFLYFRRTCSPSVLPQVPRLANSQSEGFRHAAIPRKANNEVEQPRTHGTIIYNQRYHLPLSCTLKLSKKKLHLKKF